MKPSLTPAFHRSGDPSVMRILGMLLAVWLVAVAPAGAQSAWAKRISNTPRYLGAVGHGNGIYVAVGELGAIVTSPDASTWTAASSGTSATLRDVLHHDGRFVAVGESGTVLTSPDGATWTPQTTGVSCFLSGVAYGNGRYVAAGGCGSIITSPDATHWTYATSNTAAFLQGVGFANGLFVVTGAGGTIRTSPDGITWNSPPTAPTTSYLVGSGYFLGRHHVVGLDGVILSSVNGSSWTTETSGTLSALRSFATDETTAVVCGDDGTLLKSADGTTWTPVPSGQSVILSGATFADGTFVVVGEPVANNGLILTAGRDPGILWRATTVPVSESGGSVLLTVERLGPTTTTASIGFHTTPGSAGDGTDFTSASGTAHFGIGEDTSDIVVAIANNPEAEPPEFFTVTLSSPSPAGLLLFSPSTATVQIIDAQDSDYDHLPDDWELLYFDDVASYDADDDPDGDGNANTRELSDGTNPNDPQSASYRLETGVASGRGTVTTTPELAIYPAGTTVTLLPAGTGDFTFVSWQGDVTGTANPLVVDIAADLNIAAAFEVSLGNALDAPDLDWTVGGSGPPWTGQGDVTFDGADAAETGGLASGQDSSVQATVHGPAGISFRWKVSAAQFDAYQFQIDTSTRASTSGQVDWQTKTFFIGAGPHTIRWRYARNSLSGGSNQAWLDGVALSYQFEDWQRAYFPAGDLADPSISGPEGDPDKDGLGNLLEYLCNLHPKIPDSQSPNLPSISLEQSGGQMFAAYTWSQHRDRSDTVDIAVEFSPSMAPGTWEESTVPLEVISTADGMETIRLTHPLPVTTGLEGFFRLKVTLGP